MRALAVILLLFVGLVAPGVVLTRDPLKQTVAISFYGLVFAILFFVFQAPDVALSEITVGAAVLPTMILLALVKMKRHNRLRNARGGQK
ncbi:MAG TPA: hydrogenase subunit MbhD domain-containing protein [Terriglobales bacterium]|nr:hydrogenase subunit MbhD domain-containing protein [Terriglobales bacterium]